MERRAKIVATVGPASREPTTLRRLLEAGVDAVRLNLSHGTHREHREVIARVREAARGLGRFVPVVVDLMGPRYRLGKLPEPVTLANGDAVQLGAPATGVDLPVEDISFLGHVRPGERLLIDNGRVALEVTDKAGERLTARVIDGGPVTTRKGINLPDSELPFTISEKDREDIAFAVREEVDYLAVSFVGAAVDLEPIRRLSREAGALLPVIAKLERAAALRHLVAIVQAADAIMVARGDLGVEVPLRRVPMLQKQIITAGRRAGKPVIVATQMLESMVEQPRPTRAEASDVANAVFDGADALMLSGETAAGAYPVEAVGTMAGIIAEAETYATGRPEAELIHEEPTQPLSPGQAEEESHRGDDARYFDIPDVVAAAAVHSARRLRIRYLVAFSQGGYTARTIARFRPSAPLLVFTTDPRVARRVQLVWGVRPLLLQDDVQHHDEVVRVVDRRLVADGLAEPGDVIVILMGDPIAERPLTNLMRVHRVRER